MPSRLAALLALVAQLGGCAAPSHPRPMGDRGAGSPVGAIAGGVAGGGGGGPSPTGPGTTPLPPDAPPTPPRSGPPSTPPSACETLGECCASMTGDDEDACIGVLQGYDDERCRMGVDRFCTFADICDQSGCSSAGPGG